MATYYIDPSASTNGTGTKESPYNTWNSASWTGHSATVGNQYLQKKGTTWALNGSSVQTDRSIAWSISGDASNRVIIGTYGDDTIPYASGLGSNKPKLIPGPGVTQGIVFSTNTHHVTVDGFEITGHAGKLIQNGGSTNTNDISIIIQNCYLHDNSGSFNGLDLRGQNCKVLDCIVNNIGSDAIWLDCNNAEVARTDVKNPSVNDTSGDCVQFSGTSGNIWVHDCVLDHRNKDSKHCLVISSMTAGYKGGIIENNKCYGYVNGTVNKPIYIGSQELIVRQNVFDGGFINTIAGDSTDNANYSQIYSNLFINQASYNLDIYALTTPVIGLKVYSNTFVRTLSTLSAVRNNFNTNQADFINNIFVGSNYGLEIRSLDTHSNNLFYGQTTYPIYNAQTGSQVSVPSDSINANPLLDSSYIPQTGSPALGAGIKYWTGQRPYDVLGFGVPDTNIDIGAYQSRSDLIVPTYSLDASALTYLNDKTIDFEKDTFKVTLHDEYDVEIPSEYGYTQGGKEVTNLKLDATSPSYTDILVADNVIWDAITANSITAKYAKLSKVGTKNGVTDPAVLKIIYDNHQLGKRANCGTQFIVDWKELDIAIKYITEEQSRFPYRELKTNGYLVDAFDSLTGFINSGLSNVAGSNTILAGQGPNGEDVMRIQVTANGQYRVEKTITLPLAKFTTRNGFFAQWIRIPNKTLMKSIQQYFFLTGGTQYYQRTPPLAYAAFADHTPENEWFLHIWNGENMAAAGGAPAFLSNTADCIKFRFGCGSDTLSGGIIDFGPLYYAEKHRPVITFSFDDGNITDITQAKPILDRYSFRATTHIIRDLVDGTNYLTKENIKDLYRAGWDIAGHGSYSHYDTLITYDAIRNDIIYNTEIFSQIGIPKPTMYSYPEGDHFPYSITCLRDLGFKGAGTIIASPGLQGFTDQYAYHRSGTSGKTAAALKLEVDSVIARGGILDFYAHRVSDGATGIHTDKAVFAELVEYVAEKAEIGTVEAGYTMTEYLRYK